MFERLNTPEELFRYKLGAALKMENTVLEMLGELGAHDQAASSSAGTSSPGLSSLDVVAAAPGSIMIALITAASAARAART